MALLDVVHMTDGEREDRRERDESCYWRVESELDQGLSRHSAFIRVAGQMRMDRGDVIASYWRHVRRSSPDAPGGRRADALAAYEGGR